MTVLLVLALVLGVLVAAALRGSRSRVNPPAADEPPFPLPFLHDLDLVDGGDDPDLD